MAHNLAFTPTGQAMMMSVREVPWHELGTVLDAPPTAAEAIAAASLGWTVSKKPLQLPGWLGGHAIAERMAVVRDDLDPFKDNPVLGVVGRDWQPLQNSEAFAWFDPIVATGEAVYETAGALANGRKVWILVRLREPLQVGRGDEIQPYLLLANGHDGCTSLRLRFTPVRVVCQNTWSMALAGKGPEVRVSHRPGMQMRLDDARRELARIHAGFQDIAMSCTAMQRRQIDATEHLQYLSGVFPITDHIRRSALQVRRLEAARAAARTLAFTGRGNDRPDTVGTLWAAFNGVTELLDHGDRLRSDEEQRLTSSWFGHDGSTKQRAWESALAMVN